VQIPAGQRLGIIACWGNSSQLNGFPPHSTALSFGSVQPKIVPYLNASFISSILKNSSSRKRVSTKRAVKHMSEKNKMDKVRLEFVARVTMPGGKVIERIVDADDNIPSPDDFDTSSLNGFLYSFDILEQVTLEARNRIAQDITEAFLDEMSKKNE
jgi:hypothetical protein